MIMLKAHFNALNRSKSYFAGLILVAATLGIIESVGAQYIGPGAEKISLTVAKILKNPIDDLAVTLRGKLLNKLRKDKYTFSDGTGEIRVKIDNEYFPNQKITETTVIEVKRVIVITP